MYSQSQLRFPRVWTNCYVSNLFPRLCDLKAQFIVYPSPVFSHMGIYVFNKRKWKCRWHPRRRFRQKRKRFNSALVDKKESVKKFWIYIKKKFYSIFFFLKIKWFVELLKTCTRRYTAYIFLYTYFPCVVFGVLGSDVSFFGVHRHHFTRFHK